MYYLKRVSYQFYPEYVSASINNNIHLVMNIIIT